MPVDWFLNLTAEQLLGWEFCFLESTDFVSFPLLKTGGNIKMRIFDNFSEVSGTVPRH